MKMKGSPNYAEIKETCNIHSDLTESLISEYLMYYAAGKNNLDNEKGMDPNEITRLFGDLMKKPG